MAVVAKMASGPGVENERSGTKSSHAEVTMTGPDKNTSVVTAKYGSRGRFLLLALPAITTQQNSMRHSLVARKKLAANSGSSREKDEKKRNPLKMIIMNRGQMFSESFFSTNIQRQQRTKIPMSIIGQYAR